MKKNKILNFRYVVSLFVFVFFCRHAMLCSCLTYTCDLFLRICTKQANNFALEISDAIQQTTDKVFEALGTMSSEISSHAKITPSSFFNDKHWPFETFPSYELVALSFRSMTSGATTFIATAPLVENSIKEAWETYAQENQGWIQESITYQQQNSGLVVGDDEEDDGTISPIPKKIYEYQNGQATTSKAGPYLPLWQVSPTTTHGDDISTLVNLNLLSDPVLADAFRLTKAHKEPILTKVYDDVDEEGFWNIPQANRGGNETTTQPASVVVYPLYDDPKSNNPTVVGVLAGVVTWDMFFSTVLHHGVSGMVCVLSNTCDQTFTYRLDGGSAAEFLGSGDLHDTQYDHLGSWVHVDTPLASSETCQYNVHIYPSQDLEDMYKTYKPPLFTAVMVVSFALVLAGFLVYDTAVQKRQKEAMKSAARSDAIVSSLFPAEIRDRLFNNDGEDGGKGGDVENLKTSHMLSNVSDPQKLRLKNFLSEEEIPKKGAETKPDGKIVDADNKPIADLFPHTTVMFAGKYLLKFIIQFINISVDKGH